MPRARSSASARIAVSWPFQGVIWATWPSSAAPGASPSSSRSGAGARGRVEAGVVDAVVDAHGDRAGEALVEARGRVVRDGGHGAGARARARPHGAPDQRQRQVLVGAHHERRIARRAGDRAHQPGARGVGVDHVGPEAARGRAASARPPAPSWRRPAGVCTGCRRRLASTAGSGQALDAGAVDRLREPARRPGRRRAGRGAPRSPATRRISDTSAPLQALVWLASRILTRPIGGGPRADRGEPWRRTRWVSAPSRRWCARRSRLRCPDCAPGAPCRRATPAGRPRRSRDRASAGRARTHRRPACHEHALRR